MDKALHNLIVLVASILLIFIGQKVALAGDAMYSETYKIIYSILTWIGIFLSIIGITGIIKVAMSGR